MMQLFDVISPLSAATAAIVVLLSVVYYYLKNRDILPGPKGLPYFGLFPYLRDETVHLQLHEIGQKYGDLFSFTYVGKLIINLGSVKAIREVHVNKSEYFAGRFEDFNILTYGLKDGVAMSNGEIWKSLRKYFIQTFKEFGLTTMKDNTAGPVYDSINKLMDELKARNGASFNVIDLLTERCMGTMRRVLFGEDGLSDEKLRQMNTAYGFALEGMSGVNLLLIGPFGKLVFHTLPGLRRSLAQHKVLCRLLMECVKKIESNMDENHTTCVVEDFYKERNDKKRKNDPSWKHFLDKSLVSSLAQIVGDGILSVAYFIGLFLYALVEHPEEQDKIYQELLDVVGPSRLPVNEDKAKLPYTGAFMNEVIRSSIFFPLFPSMECTKETTIRGHRIPKGSITLLNIFQAHHDPETYEEPEKFNPSRFLGAPGKQRPELPVLFGMGKRACTGESFVMMQGFLYFTSIVKHFRISEPAIQTSKSERFLMTGNMELCFTPREEK